jgi:hypothetical protein
MTEKNDVRIYEEIRKEIDIYSEDKFKVPMSNVFGRGTLAEKESFGGRSLQDNALMVDNAFEKVDELQDIWNHGHTQWMWKHINMTYHSPYNNMRQIAAEMAGKKRALQEAKWRQVKNEIKIRKIEEQLQKAEDLDYWKEVELKVKLAEMREGMVEGTRYIEGAMKDVLALESLYDNLKEKINEFSEYDIEKEETKTHLKRSIVQCLRDVRQTGSISKGEQEYAEQIGVNVGKLQALLREYVVKEVESDTWGVEGLFDFVDQVADELTDIHKVDEKRMKIQGFDPKPIETISFDTKVALLDKKEE